MSAAVSQGARVAFAPIDDILSDLRAGRMVVLVDDEKRENEGDLVCAAQFITPQVVNFMVTHARGMLCVPLEGAACDRLELHPQSRINTSQLGTAYTISVDAAPRHGTTTGVSAADRAATIKLLADPATQPGDLVRPGHVHPLRAREGGVLVRTGQTEGSVDLCRMAGLHPAAAIIEIMNDDGTMARLPQLTDFCGRHGLKMCKVADIIACRMARELLVERIAESTLQTPEGPFRLIAYRSRVDALPHVALVAGRVGQQELADPVLVRVQPHDLLGDVFHDAAHPSGRTLRAAMRAVAATGEGAIVYMRQESMGEGLTQQLQTLHPDLSSAAIPRHAARPDQAVNIGIGAQILRDLGIRNMRLLTNHPEHHYVALEGFGLSVAEMVGLEPMAV
jgi:3,4-dihydroxy 2-butanone 4-phosphate synthase / GTP cyclohydrolase II